MMMKIALLALLSPQATGAFSVFPSTSGTSTRLSTTTGRPTTDSALFSSLFGGKDDEERKRQILMEEAMNADSMKEASQRMKSMKPEDIDGMLAEMDNMPAAQLAQLKSMGMDPATMKSAMNMMKDNPAMMNKMSELMDNMTPDQLLEQSRLAQQNFGGGAVDTSVGTAAAPLEVVDAVTDDDDDDDEEPVEPDPEVLDAMYRVAEIMARTDANTEGVTFAAFASVPPIALLSRSDSDEDDLTRQELTECWNKGSLGNTRVNREGFERVWREVQDNFYNDIVEEARLRADVRRQGKRGTTKPTAVVPAPTTTTTTAPPMVGAAISAEDFSNSVKSLNDDDLTAMFDQMSDMSPEEEARMKAMGVDPAMMRKSAAMMKNNPLLRKAATAMMKNTPPEALMKASQQAQEKMLNMSEEEKQKMMDKLK